MKKITTFIVLGFIISMVSAQGGINYLKAFKSTKNTLLTEASLTDTTGYIIAANSSLGAGCPFLSADGLRLYFLSYPQGKAVDTLYSVYSVSRASRNLPFTNKKLVSTRVSKSTVLGMTNDELELYTTGNGFNMSTFSIVDSIFVQKRSTINDQFGAPQFLSFFPLTNSLVGSISFTPDKSEMVATAYVINVITSSVSTRIVRLSKSGSLYNYNDSIAVGGQIHPFVGQLSKDGLSYYVSMMNSYTTPTNSKMYVFKRAKTTDKFVSSQLCDNTINKYLFNDNISFSADMTSSVSMINQDPSDNWKTARLVSRDNIGSATPEVIKTNVSLYPNPAQGEVNITGVEGLLKVHIYNLAMELVKDVIITDKKVDLSSLSTGIYTIVIDDSEGETYVQKLIVR